MKKFNTGDWVVAYETSSGNIIGRISEYHEENSHDLEHYVITDCLSNIGVKTVFALYGVRLATLPEITELLTSQRNNERKLYEKIDKLKEKIDKLKLKNKRYEKRN